MTSRNEPVVRTQMLIRRRVDLVFEAFVDPAITANFWFTKGSGRLEEGKQVRWEWEMYGLSATVNVKSVERHRRILIEWDEPPSPVEWLFEARADESTLVKIRASGFTGSDDEKVAKALDSMGGFAIVLAGLKAFLEHGINLKLVADCYPDGHP